MQVSRDPAAHAHWLVLVAVTLASCAGTPHADPPIGTAAPPPTSVAAAASQPAVAETTQVATDPDPVTVAKSRPGYRLRNRDGTPVWCRKETPTGSRMPVETCYTAAQIEQIEAEAEDIKDTIGKERALCGASCASN
jgi:hypothetical protein